MANELLPMISVLLIAGSCGGGVVAAWLVHRRTSLSSRNWYLVAAASTLLLLLLLVAGSPAVALLGSAALQAGSTAASVVSHRWRLSALGGTGELRDHELDRVMIWEARRTGPTRTRIETQGEVVVERQWPDGVPYVPMGLSEKRARVPRGEGQHLLILGGTGSGKTVSADRILLGRVLTERIPALVLDPKGDERLLRDLDELANSVGRPLIVFDPFDEGSDRWDPLWSSEPGRTVARILSPIQTSEPYYADTLRVHLGVVAEALELLGLWPASMPLLLEAAQADKFERLRAMVLERGGPGDLLRRIEEQSRLASSPSGRRDIASGAARLRVVVGTSWRKVLTPREDGRAVQLPAAMRAGAIILWRTWVEDLPEEAEAITTLALADLIAAATELRRETEWLVLLDEFGSVMQGNAARRALGLLGRARSAGGQAIVVTQSAADVPTATGSDALLEALADNFSGFVVHRQTSADSREWVAKLIGTRELWQSTDRMGGGGRYADGTGSRRRIREFRVRPDQLKDLGVGEAIVWAPGGPRPERVDVAIPPRLSGARRVPGELTYEAAGPSDLSTAPLVRKGSEPSSPASEPVADPNAEEEFSESALSSVSRELGRWDDQRI